MKYPRILAVLVLAIQCAYGQNNWMATYYQNPLPNELSSEFRRMLDGGELEKVDFHPLLVGFLSQVMAQNPDRVRPWLIEFENLEPRKRSILLVAAWFSNTEPAKQYFRDRSLDEYLETRPQDILKLEVRAPETLDLLWGMFLATGSKEPVRRVVSALELAKYDGALERYKTMSQTKQSREEAYLEATFKAAVWSLDTYGQQHPLVVEHCEEIYAENKLTKTQRVCLETILAKLKPDKYRVNKERAEPVGMDSTKGALQ